MIESITIADIATYGPTPEGLSDLSAINFVFGANGVGKSTIARIIAKDTTPPACTVKWRDGRRLKRLVYDRDFVRRNFEESSELPGVFTLGEDQAQILGDIKAKRERLDELSEQLGRFRRTLEGDDEQTGGKRGELTEARERLQNKCWAQKQKFDETFAHAFTGVRHSMEAFRDRVLREREINDAQARSLEDLRAEAATVFSAASEKVSSIGPVQSEALLAHHESPVLQKVVVGKSDVDIAGMIESLGNSDWVRQGRVYFQKNHGVCPFCQQPTPENFAKHLEDYFDETYDNDLRKLERLALDYQQESTTVEEQITTLASEPPRFLDVEKLEVAATKLNSRLTTNRSRLAEKQKEPSRKIALEPISDVLTEIDGLIDSANRSIESHNQLVSNISAEQKRLTKEVWRYLLDVELKLDLEQYDVDRENVEKAISALETQIEDGEKEQSKIEREIRELEGQTTSVQPTIDDINQLLTAFGFDSFSLAMAETGDRYRLLRPDGEDAKETLSEGEKSFLLFLYFFHLLKGSESESGMTRDRVIVFDDPVSSLGAEILFVVASLIKSLIQEVREGSGLIKQIFVFTHNVYFHKEVTFHPKRTAAGRLKDESFWTIRKRNGISRVQHHTANPVKTSYELLWADVRDPDRSPLTIQNTLRRILENYFQILGDVDPDEICAKFEGKEQIICGSLFAWVHAGSHYAYDDVFVPAEDAGVEAYLRVFRSIFEKTGHEAHHKMMMGLLEEDAGEKESDVAEGTNGG